MKAALRLPAIGPRDLRALVMGAALVLPVVFTTVVIRPWMRAVASRRASVARERTLLLRERELVARAPRDRERLAVARHALDEAAPRLFGGTEAVTASAELARYVGDLIAESGLVLDQAESVLNEPGTGADGAPRRRTPARVDAFDTPLRVTIRAHGDAQSIVDFLRSVESGPRLVRVERVGIARGRDDSSSESATGALAFTAMLTGFARAPLLGLGGAVAAPLVTAARIGRSTP